MRVGCGSATIGIFAKQWHGHVDEVVVVDDHITGVLTEHQAGRFLAMPPSGIKIRGRKSTPGRYFQVANPGTGWGGTDVTDPLTIVTGFDPKMARPGSRILMVSTTGEDAAYFTLDEQLRMVPAEMPAAVRKVVERIGENCEPALCTVLFLAGAGGSLRAGVTENPVRLTRSIKDLLTRGDLRWRAGLCLARRRHHGDGGCHPHARQLLRLGAHAGHRRADRVHHARSRTIGRSVDTWTACGASARVIDSERVRVVGWDGLNPWPVG